MCRCVESFSFVVFFYFGDSLVKAINLTATVILHLTCRRKENGKKKTTCRIANSLPLADSHCMNFAKLSATTKENLRAISLLFTRSFSLAVYKKIYDRVPKRKKKQRRRMKRKDISLSLDIQRERKIMQREIQKYFLVCLARVNFLIFQIVGISCRGKMCF